MPLSQFPTPARGTTLNDFKDFTAFPGVLLSKAESSPAYSHLKQKGKHELFSYIVAVFRARVLFTLTLGRNTLLHKELTKHAAEVLSSSNIIACGPWEPQDIQDL